MVDITDYISICLRIWCQSFFSSQNVTVSLRLLQADYDAVQCIRFLCNFLLNLMLYGVS